MLKSSYRRNAICNNRPTPLKIDQIKNHKIVEPIFAVSTSENKHLVVYDVCSVKLSHRSFSSNYAWYYDIQTLNSFSEVNKDNIRQNLESIPSTVNYDCATVP